MGRTECFKKLNMTSADFRFCVEIPIKMHHLNIKSPKNNKLKQFKINSPRKIYNCDNNNFSHINRP